MCLGGGGSAPKPIVQNVEAPQVAATPPPAEPVAEAPVVNEGKKRSQSAEANRKGTSALRINLNLGGGEMGGGTNGLVIPNGG